MSTSCETTLSTNDFQIIWLDNHNAQQTDYANRQLDFDHFIDHLKTYEDLSKCQQYIVSLDKADKVFLIISGSIGEQTLPLLHELTQIACIYIFCIDIHKHQEWAKKLHKIRGVFNESKAMLDRLQRDIQLLLHHFTPVNIFTMQSLKETTLQNIDQEQAIYMWFQLLIDTMLKLPRTSQAFHELIEECIERYCNNDVEKRKIEQFRAELINRALRTRNIDTIFKYRYLIVDLHQRLIELHQKQYSTQSSV
ncbi:unnamed protein product, partial [Adineta ricciae]